MKIQRYEWEDAIIDAHTQGLIPNGALMLALKLSKAINWVPKDARPSGLYWANQEALDSVGASRATFYTHRPVLFELGFFTIIKGNLIPLLPDLTSVETGESLVSEVESVLETQECVAHNPYTEDTYTLETFSEDSFSEKQTIEALLVADAPTITSTMIKGESRSVDSLNWRSVASTDSFDCSHDDIPRVFTKDGQTLKQMPSEQEAACASLGGSSTYRGHSDIGRSPKGGRLI